MTSIFAPSLSAAVGSVSSLGERSLPRRRGLSASLPKTAKPTCSVKQEFTTCTNPAPLADEAEIVLTVALQRRRMLSNAAAAVALGVAQEWLGSPALAEGTSNLRLFVDEPEKFSIMVPEAWEMGMGKATGQRKVVAFYPNGDLETNVNVVITLLGPDFTSLGSFGPVEAFAENLVNSLDRSWTKPPGQKAKLVGTRNKNGMYYVEYFIQKPGEYFRQFISVVAIQRLPYYSRLITVTGQYRDGEDDQYRGLITQVVGSFKAQDA